MYVVIFPYLLLVVFFIRGVTLPGAAEGLIYLVKPDYRTLTDLYVRAGGAHLHATSLCLLGIFVYFCCYCYWGHHTLSCNHEDREVLWGLQKNPFGPRPFSRMLWLLSISHSRVDPPELLFVNLRWRGGHECGMNQLLRVSKSFFLSPLACLEENVKKELLNTRCSQ